MRIEFTIPENLSFAAIESALRKNTRLLAEPPRTVYRAYYDSFDWRLYQDNSLLEVTRDRALYTLAWRTLEGEARCARLTLPAAPRFISSLPHGSFREHLEPVLEMRELIPVARIRSVLITLRILNKNDKTVARVLLENASLIRQKGARSGKLSARATVLPVKGFVKPCKKTIKQLAALGLTPARDARLLEALSFADVTPGGYSSKLNLKLDPAMRADQAAKVITHRLLDIMLQNEAGTRAGTDSEFLHDFRVAIRRTRSALSQIKGVFPQRIVTRYKTEFAWLGQITSPSRDLDVYLLNFDNYRASLPSHAQADIEPLRDFLQRHQAIEHSALLKALDSPRYRRLITQWRGFLEQPVNPRTTLKNAGRAVLEVARERIGSIYQRVLREGNAIDSGSAAEALHDLRKTCKKLRYLMEFFQNLFPSGDIRKLIQSLKILQDNLGDFQDFEVQVITLKKLSHQMFAEDRVAPDTLLAMGMLIDGMERRQHQARADFSDRYAGFSQQDNQDRFRKLFRTR